MSKPIKPRATVESALKRNYPIPLQCNLFFFFLFLPIVGFAIEDNWICKAHDVAHQEWAAKNAYQKMAINFAFAYCKKQSKNPMSCKVSETDCEGFQQGISTKPFWRCTALDAQAAGWNSNYYANREEAGLAALSYCKAKSPAPETCFINLITCLNVNKQLGE
jgi:hypothetical protein